MIGIFDSGYGGLSILRAIRKALPEYSYVYLGDNGNAPYGPKTDEEIFRLTKQGVDTLFRKGCELVILGCNTASASALRKLQQEWMPIAWPEKKVLGIIVPTIEALSLSGHATIGVLATQHTVATNAYEKEVHKRNTNVVIIQQACNNLAGMIESLGANSEEVKKETALCVKVLLDSGKKNIEAVLLGCTHYELIADMIADILPSNTKLIRQPEIVAQSLANYLMRHPEIEQKIDRAGAVAYYTTGKAEDVSSRSSSLMGESLIFSNT